MGASRIGLDWIRWVELCVRGGKRWEEVGGRGLGGLFGGMGGGIRGYCPPGEAFRGIVHWGSNLGVFSTGGDIQVSFKTQRLKPDGAASS